jgi:hypothetical protein
MRSRRRVLLAVVVLAAATLLAVWLTRGGDESEGELTQPQLVQRLDAICSRLKSRNESLQPPPRPYDEQSTDFFAGVHDNVSEAEEALDELDAPAGADADLERLVALYGRVEVAMDNVEGSASVEQDQEVIVLLAEIGDLTREIAAVERALGACPGEKSARVSIAAVLRRTRPNPLTETGTLEPG